MQGEDKINTSDSMSTTNNKKSEKLEFDTIIAETGGFGIYQFLAIGTIILSINCAGYVIYGMNYLLLYPKFECKYADGTPIPDPSPDYDEKCQPYVFCSPDSEITYTIVEDN
mmetsp:Transcript_7598/g.11811  ORF Transcript_7598/g.11811 Transcript_7598/m.11811 type:complete len:112 (-) Transcript_7598:1412-1747(-)